MSDAPAAPSAEPGAHLHPFALSDDEVALRDLARDFAARSLAAEAGHFDQVGAVPPATLKRLRALGLTGVCAPEAADGAGLSLRALAVLTEELAAASASVATLLGHQAGPAVAALLALSPAAASGAVEGEPWVWLGVAEADGSFAPVAGAAAARGLVGLACADGSWSVLAYAPETVVVAPVEPRPLALRAAGLARVTPSAAPRAVVGITAARAHTIRAAAQVVDAAVALGTARAALDEAVRYALDRKQFGQPIAEFQAVQWMLADSATELDAARLHLWSAAAAVTDLSAEAAAPTAGQPSVAGALLLAGEMARRVTDRALQIHGGYGYTREYPVERLFRDAHYALLSAGPDGGRGAVAAARLAAD